MPARARGRPATGSPDIISIRPNGDGGRSIANCDGAQAAVPLPPPAAAANVWNPFCLCLCFGSLLQTTRTTPLRFTTRHAGHIFLTDVRTFIVPARYTRGLSIHAAQSGTQAVSREKFQPARLLPASMRPADVFDCADARALAYWYADGIVIMILNLDL